MNNTFGPSTQPFIKATLVKNKTILLGLLMSFGTRNICSKAFKVLCCVIYTIISNYVCLYYLAYEYIF